MTYKFKQHYVRFYSPGTFFSEVSDVKIDSWNVEKAKELANNITERYNATPYAFQFTTVKYNREGGQADSDAKETVDKNFYYLGGKVETYEQIVKRNDPNERILRRNMEMNNYDKVIVNTNSWKFTAFLRENDVILDYKPKKRKKTA
jgi:hypothetical protein